MTRASYSGRLLAFCALLVNAGDLHRAPAAANRDEPSLVLSSSKDTYRSREPVVLRLRISNDSTQVIRIPLLLEPEYGHLYFSILPPDGVRFRVNSHGNLDVFDGPSIDLAPGKALRHRTFLLYAPQQGFLFDRPGNYEVRAHLVGKHPGKSHPLNISVTEPENTDARAIQHFGHYPQAMFAHNLTTDWAIAQEFETIVAEYPGSVYSPWCQYFLARAWQARAQKAERASRGATTVHRKLSEKALEDYKLLLREHPNFPLETEVRYQIAREQLRLGEEEQTWQEINRLLVEHPDLALLQQIRVIRDAFDKEGLELTARQLP